MATYCSRSKKGAVIVSDSPDQVLFQEGRHIVASDHPLDFTDQNIEQVLATGLSEGIVASYKNVNVVSGGRPEGSFRKQNQDTSARLEDMLIALHRECRPTQIGIIDRWGAKALYSPAVSISKPPSNYRTRKGLCPEKSAANANFFRLLQSLLDDAASVNSRKKGNFAARALQKRKYAGIRKDIAETIDRFMDYRHGLLQRYAARRFFSEFEPGRLQQALDSEYLPKDTKSMIVSIPGRHRVDAAYKIGNETGCHARAFANFPYVALSGAKGDIISIMGRMSRVRSLRNARAPVYCHGVYTPELIQSFVGKKPGRVIPMKVINKKTLWNLENIGAYEAAKITEGGGISVAVVDSGIDTNHHELSNNFGSTLGYDFVENHNRPTDPNGHGTHVAGTIAGNSTGVAPGCRLYAVRVLNEHGAGRLEDVLLGVDWCITNNVQLANFSLGAPQGNAIEEEVYRKAMQSGVVCVAAAGNDGYGAHFPAAYDSTISVAAVDRFNHHAEFSNIYFMNNVSAPGVGIFSILPGNDYGQLSGTSMATPHITGCGALVASMMELGRMEYVKVLEATSERLGKPTDPDNWAKFGCGLVQAQRAINYGAGADILQRRRA